MPIELIQSVTSSYLNSFIDWSTNSGETSNRITDDPLMFHNPFKSTRQYIKLEQSFLKQLDENSGVLNSQSQYSLKEKMKLSAEAILDCIPDKISLQLTDVGSIFYIAIKDNLKIYFEHFLVDDFNDNDEAIITIFMDDEKVFNHPGELAEVIDAFSKFMGSKNIKVRQLA